MPKEPTTSTNDMSRRALFAGSAALAGSTLIGLPPAAGATWSAQRSQLSATELELFSQGFPRAFFFRQSEQAVADLPYAEWDTQYSRLGGIVGKILTEEKPDSTGPKNVEYFTRFKREHPEQLVVMHYNGRLRDPLFDPFDLFSFAGHFIYRAGTTLTAPVSADPADNVLHVADTSVFWLNVSNVREDVHDDIGLAVVGPDEKPDWHESEQLRLLDINEEAGTITVERGAYRTTPAEFAEGSYLAAHLATGPWCPDEECRRIWFINLSPDAPRDAAGHNGIDVFVDDLARHFEPGGDLETIDGVQLDVFSFTVDALDPEQNVLVDIDNDGVADGGFIDGVNVYAHGQLEVMRRLRERLPHKLINTDGGALDVPIADLTQRPNYALTNGIEKEGFPRPADVNYVDWTTVLGALQFLDERSRPPSFNFINHNRPAWVRPPEPVVYSDLRLAWAASQLAGVALTLRGDGEPDREDENVVPVLDEDWQGVEQQNYWLGRPLSDAVHLPERTRDLLAGQGVAWTRSFIERFEGDGARFDRRRRSGRPAMAISFSGEANTGGFPEQRAIFGTRADGHAFRLSDIEVPSEDLFVRLDLSADPVAGFPDTIGRLLKVAATPQGADEFGHILLTYCDSEVFAATFYFRNVGPGPVNLDFLAEGGSSLAFHTLRAHSSQDAMYREFENGVVFANPTPRPYTFDVADLFPGQSFRKLQGSPEQDRETNNGQPVGAELTLSPTDALAVVRDLEGTP